MRHVLATMKAYLKTENLFPHELWQKIMQLLLAIFLIIFAFIGHELIHIFQLRIKGYRGKIKMCLYPSLKDGTIMAVNYKGRKPLLDDKDECIALGFTLLLLILAGQMIFGY